MYCCLTSGVNQLQWVRSVLHELTLGYVRATPVYTDNITAQNFVENPVYHSRMKQLYLKFPNLRELSEWHVIVCEKIPTEVNSADLGTKPLDASETAGIYRRLEPSGLRAGPAIGDHLQRRVCVIRRLSDISAQGVC